MRIQIILALFIMLAITSCNENTVEPVLFGNISGTVYSPDGKTGVSGVSIQQIPLPVQ